MLNVVGLMNRDKDGKFVNFLLAVTSFDFYPDGSPGISEMSGMISIKDFLVRVNDTDLTRTDFSTSMNILSHATWPKTLHFMRDNLGNRDGPKIEGWSFVYYPALKRKRLRYIELLHDAISFFIAEPGGSVSGKRDAFFRINQVQCIKPIINLTKPKQQQCSLILVCYDNKGIVNHVRDDDTSRSGFYTDSVELSFPTLKQLNRWRSALVSPVTMSDGSTFHLKAMPLQTVVA